MDKANIIRSSEFHMSEGDILHYILILDAGVAPTISLVSTGDIANSEEAPDAVVALDASDITSSSFTANWHLIENASAYYLDVATDSAFTSFVAGYNNLSVGYVKEYPVVGLDDAITYYYRVRGANHIGTGDSSNTITTTTANEVVTDADGNVYTYVTIGTQQWMVENFRSEHYADGTAIPIIEDSEFNDWFLPSIDEYQLMQNNLNAFGVGGFDNTVGVLYHSSSEFDATFNYKFAFYNNHQYVYNKNVANVFRACRSFSSAESYSVRDIGPAGGLIFYASGGNYLEAAPTDSAASVWSNIDLLIGTTGTAVGTGQANTLAIIGQAGHTTSAALVCNSASFGGWINDTTGAMCYYDNDEATYKADYGALYNWYAVDNAHGLAPAGWRVPSLVDFSTLSTFIGGDATAGSKLRDIGLTYWNSPNTGATNEYGFSWRGSGQRNGISGASQALKKQNSLWTSTAFNATLSYQYVTIYNSENITPSEFNIKYGFSVRMMRDV